MPLYPLGREWLDTTQALLPPPWALHQPAHLDQASCRVPPLLKVLLPVLLLNLQGEA